MSCLRMVSVAYGRDDCSSDTIAAEDAVDAAGHRTEHQSCPRRQLKESLGNAHFRSIAVVVVVGDSVESSAGEDSERNSVRQNRPRK